MESLNYRPDIRDYLVTEVSGAWPPDMILEFKPEDTGNGLETVVVKQSRSIRFDELFELLGLSGTKVSIPVFYTLCEKILTNWENNPK